MKRLLVALLVCIVAAGCGGGLRPGGGPAPPRYVGDWSEQPANEGEGKTLHINEPSDCACSVAKALRTNPTAIFFNDINTAHNAGFTKHCAACASLGTECQQHLPPQL